MAERNRIRELIEVEPGLTFERFAVRVGVAEKTVRNAAKGLPTHPSTRKLIARGFGLTFEEVFPSDASYYSSNADAA